MYGFDITGNPQTPSRKRPSTAATKFKVGTQNVVGPLVFVKDIHERHTSLCFTESTFTSLGRQQTTHACPCRGTVKAAGFSD